MTWSRPCSPRRCRRRVRRILWRNRIIRGRWRSSAWSKEVVAARWGDRSSWSSSTPPHPPPTGLPTVDFGIPVEVPWRVLCDLADNADIHTVVTRNGVVLHAPGLLNLGRSSRLANRAQRRALRALYPTCAITGCEVGFAQCHIHHVIWYDKDGRTDLDNLLPLCSRHHHNVHDDGWILHLAPDRTLTVTMPDGRTMTTGPPKRRAA